MPFDRTLAEVLHTYKDSILDDIAGSIPATVTAVHPDRQTVDVQTAIQNTLFDEFGNVTFEQPPSFADVPIGVLRGGKFFIWMPLAVGDSCLLVFSQRSMDAWRAAVHGPQPVEPGWTAKHTADSPVAIPCIGVDASFFADPNTDPTKIIIGMDGSQAQIRISATEIELGATHGDAVALASLVSSLIANLATWIKTGVAPSGGGPVTYASPAPSTSVASTVVKAQ